MRKKHVKGATVSLSVRDTALKWSGAQESIRDATNSATTIFATTMRIFAKIWKLPEPIMSLRVAVSNLCKDAHVQLDLFGETDREQKNEKLSTVFDNIRRKYGVTSVQFGGALGSEFKLHFDVLDE